MPDTNERQNPARHQPTAAELNEPVKIDATLEDLRAAMVRGGAERVEAAKTE